MRVADLGLRFVITCVLGAAVGFWLDRKFALLGRFPILTLVGFFAGLAGAMTMLIRGLGEPRDDEKTEDSPESRRDD